MVFHKLILFLLFCSFTISTESLQTTNPENMVLIGESLVMVCIVSLHFNPLTNSKILDWSKLNVAEILIFLSDRVENIVGKGENAGYQCFLLSDNVFKSLIFFWVCVVKS